MSSPRERRPTSEPEPEPVPSSNGELESLDFLRAALARINGIFGPSEELLGYTVTWEDMSQWRVLEDEQAGLASQLAAIGKSMAVCEFQMDGTVVTANDNFLKIFGYTLDEVKGRHHGLFVDE